MPRSSCHAAIVYACIFALSSVGSSYSRANRLIESSFWRYPCHSAPWFWMSSATSPKMKAYTIPLISVVTIANARSYTLTGRTSP